jgi:hypothetical protein
MCCLPFALSKDSERSGARYFLRFFLRFVKLSGLLGCAVTVQTEWTVYLESRKLAISEDSSSFPRLAFRIKGLSCHRLPRRIK